MTDPNQPRPGEPAAQGATPAPAAPPGHLPPQGHPVPGGPASAAGHPADAGQPPPPAPSFPAAPGFPAGTSHPAPAGSHPAAGTGYPAAPIGHAPAPGYHPAPPGYADRPAAAGAPPPGFPPAAYGAAPYPDVPRRRGAVWPVLAIVAILVAVAGWVTAGALLLTDEPPAPEHPSVARDAARDAARRAACELTTAMSTYDYHDLSGFEASVVDRSTGELRRQFETTYDSLEQVMKQSQVTSHVEDLECLYRSGDGDKIDILSIFAQVRTNNAASAPQSTRLTITTTMRLVDGKWLAEKLDTPVTK
ncbi:hypothetical protein ACWEQ0_18270 [Nocardia thailandica]